MGLYDRDYMRDEEPGYRPVRARPWSPTIGLLVALGAIFLAQGIVARLNGMPWSYFLFGAPAGIGVPLDPLAANFALSLAGIKQWQLWQLLTFQFLHGGILHLLLNGVTLFSFGRFLERELGRGRFLALYFISGTAGGLLQVTATWLLRQNPDVPVVGASAGIAGLLGAFMLSYPDLRLMVFPIPFKIRAWTMLWIVLPVSVIGTVFPFGGVAHAAHLGGLLAGGAFVRWNWGSRRHATPPPFINAPSDVPVQSKAEAAKDDFIASEVDPILEKIHTHGIHSLTEREREILAKARSQIEKR